MTLSQPRSSWFAVCASALAILLAILVAPSFAGVVSADLERALRFRGTHADTAVIVRFKDAVDLDEFTVTDRRRRDGRLVVALQARTASHRAAVESLLSELAPQRVRELWIVNALALTLPAHAVARLAAHPSVERVDLDSFVRGGHSQRMPARHQSQVQPSERVAPAPTEPTGEPTDASAAALVPAWNIAAVHAPKLWKQGHTGRGVVVASMDTGVDLAHPDLLRKWRGGSNGWFDPHGEEPRPYDALGHGTQAMGVMVGGRAVGVAPDARWIGVRLFNSDGRASMSDIHRALQWLMDPDDDPTTADAPDVVNASWTLSGRGPGTCIGEFREDIRALHAAGIAVVFAAGNDGPARATSSSPANNPGALSVGAVDRDMAVARQSGRGPSACDDSVFPRLVAPGVAIRATDLSHGGLPSLTSNTGTSLAAPHVAGVMALLMSAFPDASLVELEAALVRGARDLGMPGPDGESGYGLVDAWGAFEQLRSARKTDHPQLNVAEPMRVGQDEQR